MAEQELKTVLGFEASQAIATLANLTSGLQGYNTAIRLAAIGTGQFNRAAAKVDTALKTLAAGSNLSGKSIKALSRGVLQIETWLPGDHFLKTAAMAAGFEEHDEPLGIIATIKSFDHSPDTDWIDNNFFYTMADSDLV